MGRRHRTGALLVAGVLLGAGGRAGTVYPIRLDAAPGAVAIEAVTALPIRTPHHYENRVALTVVAAATEPILRITATQPLTTVSMTVTIAAFQDSSASVDYLRQERVSLLRKTDGTWQFNRHSVPGGSTAITITYDLATHEIMTMTLQTPAGASQVTLFVEAFSNKPIVVEDLF